jgi:hypothetical protein
MVTQRMRPLSVRLAAFLYNVTQRTEKKIVAFYDWNESKSIGGNHNDQA